MKKVSLLIPVYNEEKVLPELKSQLDNLMQRHPNYEWEVLLINDGSEDKSLDILRSYHREDERYCYLDLSRNFGKEKTMLAGFDYVTGDCVINMDADLQDPPEVIDEMLKCWENGYDDVYGRRKTRGKESWLRKRLTLSFYWLLQKMSKVDILPNVGDFRLLDRKCVNALRQLRESERYTKGLYCWIGYNKKEIEFDRQNRAAGTSSWNFFSLFNLAVDGITTFSVAPLRLASIAGIIISILCFALMLFYFVKALIFGDAATGFPTLVVLILFLGGVQLIALGIIGEYLGRIFIETKRRPVYIAREYNGEQI